MEVAVGFNRRELSRVQRQIESLSKSTGLTVQWLCADQMRLACHDGIKFVAPWDGGKAGMGSSQRKVGEGAVEHDLDRLFARIDKAKYVYWTGKKTGKQYAKNIETGRIFTIEQDHFDRTDLQAIHHKHRNSRGRVGKQNRQFWVKKALLNKYTKEVKSHVGRLKASWLPGFRYFQSVVGGGNRVSAWVSRHRGDGTHSGLTTMSKSGNGYLSATSTAPHVRAIRSDVIPYILVNRERSMKRYSPKRLEQLAAQFNSNRTTITPVRQLAPA
jgi:hypothetical protein